MARGVDTALLRSFVAAVRAGSISRTATVLLTAGATAVYGLSSRDVADQREAVTRLRLPFAMLSDPDPVLAAVPGLPTFETSGMRFYARTRLIVRDGLIERVLHPIDSPGGHAGQVLTWLRGAP